MVFHHAPISWKELGNQQQHTRSIDWQGGLLEWLSHSPGFTFPIFFCGAIAKTNQIYSAKPHSIAELIEQSQVAIAQLPLNLCAKYATQSLKD